MTREKREQLIRHLKYNLEIGADYLITDEDAVEIIKALEQEPCEEELDFVQEHKKISCNLIVDPCEDCISRQAVLDCFTATKLKKFDFILHAREEIKKLPFVNPQPKTGHWKYYQNDKGDWINKCSVCGSDAGVGYQYPYCPNCGAKMEGSDADSD